MHHLDWGLIRPEECLGMSGVTGCRNSSHFPCRPAMFVFSGMHLIIVALLSLVSTLKGSAVHSQQMYVFLAVQFFTGFEHLLLIRCCVHLLTTCFLLPCPPPYNSSLLFSPVSVSSSGTCWNQRNLLSALWFRLLKGRMLLRVPTT